MGKRVGKKLGRGCQFGTEGGDDLKSSEGKRESFFVWLHQPGKRGG